MQNLSDSFTSRFLFIQLLLSKNDIFCLLSSSDQIADRQFTVNTLRFTDRRVDGPSDEPRLHSSLQEKTWKRPSGISPPHWILFRGSVNARHTFQILLTQLWATCVGPYKKYSPIRNELFLDIEFITQNFYPEPLAKRRNQPFFNPINKIQFNQMESSAQCWKVKEKRCVGCFR